MAEVCGGKVFSVRHMKKKIVEHFRDSIVISLLHGKSDIVNLKQTAASIVTCFIIAKKQSLLKKKKTI